MRFKWMGRFIALMGVAFVAFIAFVGVLIAFIAFVGAFVAFIAFVGAFIACIASIAHTSSGGEWCQMSVKVT